MDEFPSEVENREHEDHGIREEECRDGPIAGKKDGVTANNGHGAGTDASEIGDVRLEPTAIRQGFPRNALRVECLLESDESKGDDGEVNELRSGDLNFAVSWTYR